LRRLVSTIPREFAALHFDRIYRMPNPPFKAAASQFLVRMVQGRKPGKAPDVAMEKAEIRTTWPRKAGMSPGTTSPTAVWRRRANWPKRPV
jgi:hypothetical protein